MLERLKSPRRARGFIDSMHAEAVKGRIVFEEREAIEGLARIEQRYGLGPHTDRLHLKAKVLIKPDRRRIDLFTLPDAYTYIEALHAAGHGKFAVMVYDEKDRKAAEAYVRSSVPSADVEIRVHPTMPFRTGEILDDGRIAIVL